MERGFSDRLTLTRRRNNRAAQLLADYLNAAPRTITAELMAEMSADTALPQEYLYRVLLGSLLGLDAEQSAEDKELSERYLSGGVHRMDVSAYRCNPYYANISVPHVKSGSWELSDDFYSPFEAFVCRDITLNSDLTEIPHIGYFDEEFRFPVVRQSGREWMAVKPNEIETMQGALDAVGGKVATLGLGLGYFTYMASLKSDVSSITVVEKDARAIELFKRYILPQFSQSQKVKIVECDAFEFVEQIAPQCGYDCIFADLWHDAADGLVPYMRLKRLEAAMPQTRFLYWIEESLLSALRWQLFDSVMGICTSEDEAARCLSDEFLRKFAAQNMHDTLKMYEMFRNGVT